MDYGLFYDIVKTSPQRLLRYYCCAVATKVIEEAKTSAIKRAISYGHEMAMGKAFYLQSHEIRKLETYLRGLVDCDYLHRRIAREAALLCIGASVPIHMMISVVNGVRQFKGRSFDDGIAECIRPNRVRKSAGTRNRDVKAIATNIHEGQDWDSVPVLADAMEEFGVGDDEAIQHLRLRHHWRGCWVIDEALGAW